MCGHANSGLSLFCAECGSVLNAGPDSRPDTSSATTTAPSESDTQQTQAFSPGAVAPGDERWSASSSSDPMATAPFQPASKAGAGAGVAAATPLTSPNGRETGTSATTATSASIPTDARASGRRVSEPATTGMLVAEEPPESLRGFFFGVVAVILILIVAAVFAWTILPNGGLRDTIQGWLDAIPV
ncbi:MAG: hypothetical protein ACR2OE_00840 [Thermomicrobiales bacterium]